MFQLKPDFKCLKILTLRQMKSKKFYTPPPQIQAFITNKDCIPWPIIII